MDVTPDSPPTHVYPRGNLTLLVGESNTAFVADASALRLHSLAFREHLARDGTVVGQGLTKTVRMSDTDPAAMEVLLNIVHDRPDQVPEKPDLALLHKIMLVADDFYMTGVLQPWAQSWADVANDADDLESLREYRDPNIFDLQRMACLWYLRRPELGRWFLAVLAKTEKSEDGQLKFSARAPDGRKLDVVWDDVMPCDTAKMALMGHTNKFRDEALQPLLDSLEAMILSCTEDRDEDRLSQRCARQCLGIIYERLHYHKLAPLPKLCYIPFSPVGLSEIICSIISEISSELTEHCRCGSMTAVDGETKANHTQCEFPLDDVIPLSDIIADSVRPGVIATFQRMYKSVARGIELRNQWGWES